MVAGRNTFLHELLMIAGGSNVAEGMADQYPRIEREQLMSMKPQVILHLIPSASPQEIAKAKEFWALLPELPAVKNKRVVQITEWYALLPGYHVGEMARRFSRALHPAQ